MSSDGLLPEAILRSLALCPAASFHEELVARTITRLLDDIGVSYWTDTYGNIVAEYKEGAGAPPLATVAHMDHPAFEITEDGAALLLGGIGRSYLQAGTPLRVFTTAGAVSGEVTECEPEADAGRVTFHFRAAGKVEVGDWGVWEMDDFREDGDLLHLRAADDLAGCAVALSTLAALKEQRAGARLYAVFTRAEEVGLIGATLVAQQGLLPKETVVISLESSKVLPGVEQGVGPVIRVGDARRTFDADGEALLRSAAEELRTRDPGFKVQRHLMSGGTCEATAFGLYGYTTTGIALPLGNYHNMSDDGRLAAECIHRGDLQGACDLLLAAVLGAAGADRLAGKERLIALAEAHQERLRATATKFRVSGFGFRGGSGTRNSKR